MRDKYRLVFAALLLIALDQLVKFIILKYFGSIATINPKGGFSLGLGSSNFTYISVMAFVAFSAILFFFEKSALSTYGYILVLAGTFSNIIDRFIRHGVVDYISIKIWPTFNIADSLIVIGVGLLILREFKKKSSA